MDRENFFVSFSQNGEDVMLYRALKGIPKGFYIDVGAWDPIVDSVTNAFYERGWRGINIEPCRNYYEKLVVNRPEDVNLMVVVSNQRGLVKFFEVTGTGLSTTKKELADFYKKQGYEVKEYLIPSLPLTEICAANNVKEIHFLKIDVEGAEKEVVESLDFEVYRPWIVLIEAVDPITKEPVTPEWEAVLFRHGYEFVYYDGLNRFYLAREKADLKKAFATPPGFFDGFIRYSEWSARQEAQQLQNRLAEIQARAEAERAILTQQLQALQAKLEERDRHINELTAQVSLRDKQIEELNRWLKAVYTSTSWRITAPLRWFKEALVEAMEGIRAQVRKGTRLAGRLALRLARKLVRWAAQNPRLRSLGKKLLSRTPTLKARVRRFIIQGTPMAAGTIAVPELPIEANLPESAQIILEELRAALNQAFSQKNHENRY